jgi:hypothetical protein
MRGLDPRIHAFGCFKTWMAGTSGAKTALRAFCPAMTDERFEDVDGRHKAGHDG